MTNFLIYSHQKIYLLFKLSCGNGPQEHIRRREKERGGEGEREREIDNTRVLQVVCGRKQRRTQLSSGTDRILMPFSLCELVWVLCCSYCGSPDALVCCTPSAPTPPPSSLVACVPLSCSALCFAYFKAKLTRCHQSIRMFSSFFTHFP